uniref:Ankyrin repeat-containing protein At3g12360-like isoform X1 n=1 Tax=Rhizophora mucronata TaxID=61149 RepID=A0A2P2MNT7_RHIMU
MSSTSTPLLTKETQRTLPASRIETEKWHFQGGDDGDLEDGSSRTMEDGAQRKLQLYRAAITGQWEIAAKIHEDDPKVINDRITESGDTALHVAAAAGHTQFVSRLIPIMTPDAVRIKNYAGKDKKDPGNTAFCHAAITGNVEMADIMVQAVEGLDLVTIRGKENNLPLYLAALFGHKKMVDYLYEKTVDGMNDQDRIGLLVTLVDNDMYDIAIKMVEDHPELAIAEDTNGKTAFHALARKNSDHQIAWNDGIDLCYGKEVQEKYTRHQGHLKLVQLLCQDLLQYNDSNISEVNRNEDSQISKVTKSSKHLIFKAAEQGNVDFLTALIGSYPDLLFELDENKRSIFHIAVLHRQEHVFALIKTIGSIKYFLATHKDENNNNMLHLAGRLPPQSRLDVVTGAALQLQRELLWFEEVKKVVQPKYIEDKNKDGKTPLAVFLEEHEKLIDDGKTWMKDMANKCMIVATYIAGVAFAAALSVPSGTDGGVPVLLKQTSFQVFTVADGLSLIFSIFALLNFVSFLTSRRQLEDRHSLPRRLVLGLGTLFISIAALMFAVVAAFFIVFEHGKLGLFVPIARLAPIPVFLFIFQQHRFIGDVFRSTYVSTSMFQPDKHFLLSAYMKKKSLPNSWGTNL